LAWDKNQPFWNKMSHIATLEKKEPENEKRMPEYRHSLLT
jgi:hypothetical protein